MNARRAIAFFIQIHLFDGAFYQADLVIGVINHEIRVERQVLCFTAQNASADGVKGSQGQPARVVSEQFGNPIVHLAGGLVRKGDRQNMVRADTHRAD